MRSVTCISLTVWFITLCVVLSGGSVYAQSSHTIQTTAEQDLSLDYWLAERAERDNSDAVTHSEALQFMSDRTLRGLARERGDHIDQQRATAYRGASPDIQRQIEQLLTRPVFGETVGDTE